MGAKSASPQAQPRHRPCPNCVTPPIHRGRTVSGSGPGGAGAVGSFAGDGGPATEARLWTVFGVAIDPAGNLLISDGVNKRIRKVIGVAAPGVIAGR